MIHSLALARAEKALNDAKDTDALEAAWDDLCDFPDESDEREHLLAVYRARAEEMALRLVEILRA
jgi:hypothetical protein